eukprot:377895-Pelagomonas_calceolata.AAC.7
MGIFGHSWALNCAHTHGESPVQSPIHYSWAHMGNQPCTHPWALICALAHGYSTVYSPKGTHPCAHSWAFTHWTHVPISWHPGHRPVA